VAEVPGIHARFLLDWPRFKLDVDLRVPAGGVTVLFGRSGSGKTTLLRCIAGLERASQGYLSINGEVWQDGDRWVPPHQRPLGYVFQEASLFQHLTVMGNLRYGVRRVTEKPQVSMEHAIELLGIGHLLDRKPDLLSGGERQRVGIARALAVSPRLLLMDEPLASLDSARKSEILHYIERLRDEIKIPIVYVSHAIEEVTRLADTLVLVSDGKVTGVGSVPELAARLDLRNQLGRFEGGAIIDARVVAQDLVTGLAHLAFDGGELLTTDLDSLVGERVRVRIRARDVSIALERPRGISILNCLAGTVAEISGQDSGADVRIAVGATSIIARVTRHSIQALQLAPGLPVYALVKAVSLDRHSVGYA
jgi:molybdate transport system ATP-binding protein